MRTPFVPKARRTVRAKQNTQRAKQKMATRPVGLQPLGEERATWGVSVRLSGAGRNYIETASLSEKQRCLLEHQAPALLQQLERWQQTQAKQSQAMSPRGEGVVPVVSPKAASGGVTPDGGDVPSGAPLRQAASGRMSGRREARGVGEVRGGGG